MTPAEGINKHGFRTWYERQLIESHLYLVTCLLSAVLVLACVEMIGTQGSFPEQLFLLALVIGGAYLALVSLRRYNFLMWRAEVLGSQSSCPRCEAYGVLKVLGVDGQGGASAGAIRVRCKKCAHEWRMEQGD